TGVANTSALEDAIAHALPDETAGDYTADSWSDYQDALQAAKDLLTREPAASQAEVDAALQTLSDAQTALVDLSALRALIVDALTDEFSYTPETWNEYENALEHAETVLVDPDATQAEVDAALEA